MILRPRQKVFVDHCVTALHEYGNSLGVAPTGAGKTIMLSAVAGHLYQQGYKKSCILAHRDELISQNRDKFNKVNGTISTSIYNAEVKDLRGEAVFAMVQTLSREQNLENIPHFDLLIIDEAHHAAAPSYQKIIEKIKEVNPKVLLLGLTATPNRGDKKALRPIFSNVADQITVAELIASGHLVPPKTFVLNVGTQEALEDVKKSILDFDMGAVEKIMNKDAVNEQVIKYWKEKSEGRKTVIFCSTIVHALSVFDSFRNIGIKTAIVHGKLSTAERERNLYAYEQGDAEVIINVAVLTEGWDYQPTSCVVLLRPSSFKSTMVQMIGRGLRTVDMNLYPKVRKQDCIVLDFGISTKIHGCLEEDINLDGGEVGEAPRKDCPECDAIIPISSMECPLCGHVFEKQEKDESDENLNLGDVHLMEIELMKRSPFIWENIFGDEEAYAACGFKAWSVVLAYKNQWYAIGGSKDLPAKLLTVGEKIPALASANDFLNEIETDDSAHKSKRWVGQSASDKQLKYLPARFKNNYNLTKYRASALLNFRFNQNHIYALLSKYGGNA